MNAILVRSGCTALTWPRAAWVLGGFVRLVMAVKLSVTLPGGLDKAASVGTAELIGPTCRIFYSREIHTSEGDSAA